MAWEVFCSASSRTRGGAGERDHFEIDWQLVRLLLEVKGIENPEELVDKLIALLKGLNQ